MVKLSKHVILFSFLSICIASFFVANYIFSQNDTSSTLWQYQCIDTMKVSRDRARSLGTDTPAQKEIAKEIAIIKSLGANCVAIGTPYDDEFVPVITLWAQEAHAANLHVWFRGNFSSWEGWFNYPKGMTQQEHLDKTKQFITTHANIFKNGDIFTPAPEAENGWGSGYVPQDQYPQFRQFLIDEHQNAQDAFKEIGKNVITNWLSMNGSLAMNMLDGPTIQALGDTVTIDHYVKDPTEMKQYIDYFSQTFHAKVVIGEFGAPIPDINGTMSQQEQQQFVSDIFDTLYTEGTAVYGVNYWVLKDGTTSLLDNADNRKPVTQVIQQYYRPSIITGRVVDEIGTPLGDVQINVNHMEQNALSNQNGQYTIKTPEKQSGITISKAGYIMHSQSVVRIDGTQVHYTTILAPQSPSMTYTLRLTLKHFFAVLFKR